MLTQLRDIGLSENEAKVYLAMLELGPATVLQIAGKAGINRPTTYVQIESLKRRGLVEVIQKGKKAQFVAREPSALDAMLEREAKEVEVQKTELAKVLPQLQTMYDLAGKKPVVRYFEGIEGLRQMQEEFLRCKEKIVYGIFNLDQVLDVFPKHRSDYSGRRVARGIRSRSIYTSSGGPSLMESDEERLREVRFIDPKRFRFNADITIFDDSIALTSFEGRLSGTVITNPELAKSFKGLFEFLWETASK